MHLGSLGHSTSQFITCGRYYNKENILPAFAPHHLHQTFLEYATTESNPWTTGVTNGKNAIILKELATVYIQHLPEQSTKEIEHGT